MNNYDSTVNRSSISSSSNSDYVNKFRDNVNAPTLTVTAADMNSKTVKTNSNFSSMRLSDGTGINIYYMVTPVHMLTLL